MGPILRQLTESIVAPLLFGLAVQGFRLGLLTPHDYTPRGTPGGAAGATMAPSSGVPARAEGGGHACAADGTLPHLLQGLCQGGGGGGRALYGGVLARRLHHRLARAALRRPGHAALFYRSLSPPSPRRAWAAGAALSRPRRAAFRFV
eukprot:1182279-Prorocentrum_minimum.AAC.2